MHTLLRDVEDFLLASRALVRRGSAASLWGSTLVPLARARLLIERRNCGANPDTDGLIGGCKGLIDVLLPMHEKRRPYGLGLILDDNDNDKCLVLEVRALRVPRKAIGMRVTITNLEG